MRQLLLLLVGCCALAAEAWAQGRPRSEEFTVPSPHGHTVAGVLEAPAHASGPRATVVLIAGAGPSDRDGYTLRTSRGHNGAFRDLSAELTARGFNVVRHDKVGTGRSSGEYRRTATTATLADDVAAIVAWLRRHPEVDPERISLVGHSEGGAIAARVAAADARVAGVALLAAPAWSGRRIMGYQVRLAAERHHRSVSYTSADLIEARLARDLQDRAETEAWYPFFLDYDPLPAMRALRMPVLILQGERDEAVLFEQAYEIRDAVQSNGNAQVALQLYPAYGHEFTSRRDGRGALPRIAADVTQRIGDWLAERAAPASAVGTR